MFHTHPSGDPSPSPEDIHVTHRMVQAAEVVGAGIVGFHLPESEVPAAIAAETRSEGKKGGRRKARAAA